MAIKNLSLGLGRSSHISPFMPNGQQAASNIYNANSSNVGIGTNTPGTYKLAVAGKIASWGEIRVLNLNHEPFGYE
jgi:hypothetical protein